MEYKDYYKILGVDKKASADDIKKSYRRLARKYHPDVSKEADAENKFKDVQEAYEVLKDNEKRQAYDSLGSDWRQGQEFRPPPGWQGQDGTRFYTTGGQGFNPEDLEGFSDFFSNIFGGGGARQAHAHAQRQSFKQRGADQEFKVQIPLEEAFTGTTKTLNLQFPEADANGQVTHKTRSIKFTIPAGVTDGKQLRLAGQGAPGFGGGPAGDLYLKITVAPHKYFSLQGSDVYLTLPVTPWEAALGAEIQVPTLGGKVGLKLPAGSKAGSKLRLKGRGMPGKTAGDQYVIVQIQTPPAKTDAEKALYEKMSQEMTFNPRTEW